MSGDVQPRKRKDKKKKKDDTVEETIPIQRPPPAPVAHDDHTNIHVHKDSGTGGGLCAKFVFFVLFAALISIIGLTITEYRGLTDLDTIDVESRFSQIFAGWIDTTSDHDHEDDQLDTLSHEDVSEEDDAEEHVASEEEEEEQEEEDDDTETASEEEDEDEATHEEDDEVTQEEDDEATQEEDEEEEGQDSDEVEQDDEEEEEEEEHSEEEEEEQNDIVGRDAEDDENAEEDDDKPEVEETLLEAEQGPETTNVTVKIGVGVAILVVAYIVLVRKWKNGEPSVKPVETVEENIPDLARRNTIVTPPSLEEVEPDMENIEEDYSEEDEDPESEEEPVRKTNAAKLKYRDLQYTYSRSLTPDGEPKYEEPPLPSDTFEYYRQDDDEEEEEEGDDEEDEYEEESDIEDDDEELLKKLEAKYGQLPKRDYDEEDNERFETWKRVRASDNDAESNSDDEKVPTSGAQYINANITSPDDWLIKDDIDDAQAQIQNNAAYALIMFDAILEKYPTSPRALFGKAQSLDTLADKKRSNEILQKAIATYMQVLDTPSTPDILFQTAAERSINRIHFLGRYAQAVGVHDKLIRKFPNTAEHRNKLAITYLTINKIPQAKQVIKETLVRWPTNGMALVHYGFILKTTDNKLDEAVSYLRKGIGTKEEGVLDGRFYFHLGDALSRLGKTEEAMEVYMEGVKNKVFLSKYQRSLYNIPRLTGQPWWNLNDTPHESFFKTLESNWKQIRQEGLNAVNEQGFFKDESENLKDRGNWKQLELFARGIKHEKNCKKCPFSCKIISSLADASGCRRGQVKFSVMHPGTHVWPHCGPTNCRLRAHLGLKVPENTHIRVAEETRSWEEGKVFIFDDSFEHEVWHNGTGVRLVLIIDIWHPELSPTEKRTLSPI